MLCPPVWSGRRGSNPRPPAWKASALSTELLPQHRVLNKRGHRWIRTTEGESQQIYSLPHLATLEYALHKIYGAVPRLVTARVGRIGLHILEPAAGSLTSSFIVIILKASFRLLSMNDLVTRIGFKPITF